MAANYQPRRIKRLKQADSGVKRGAKLQVWQGDAPIKKQKSLRKRVDLPRTMFYYNDVLKRKTNKKEVTNMNTYLVENPVTGYQERLTARELQAWANELQGWRDDLTLDQGVELLENRGYIVDLIW